MWWIGWRWPASSILSSVSLCLVDSFIQTLFSPAHLSSDNAQTSWARSSAQTVGLTGPDRKDFLVSEHAKRVRIRVRPSRSAWLTAIEERSAYWAIHLLWWGSMSLDCQTRKTRARQLVREGRSDSFVQIGFKFRFIFNFSRFFSFSQEQKSSKSGGGIIAPFVLAKKSIILPNATEI